jgi:short-subunit dehydrogenase
MAAIGFNICVIARNSTKTQEKLALIEQEFKVATKAVIFDFSKHFSIEEYKSLIADKVADLDIAMLFLNAGYCQVGAFSDITNDDVQQMVSINTL